MGTADLAPTDTDELGPRRPLQPRPLAWPLVVFFRLFYINKPVAIRVV